MKITYHWMREFAPLDQTPADVAAQLTLEGLEVEAVTAVAPPFNGVVVGEVLTVGRHPDAAKLSVCEVTTDGSNRLQIICGAPNVRQGLKVAVAMVGARLPGDVTIRRAKLRGLESLGMLCSARELGLGVEHDGIMELPVDLALNRDLRDALDLDDTAFDVNATPNRGDCMSVLGIVRDYVAARQRRYLTHAVAPVEPAHDGVFAAEVAEPLACPVFTSRIVSGVRAGAVSPAWLKERLRRVGINSISPVVDITNYVAVELGQPMHAYDLARLTGRITVRMAAKGERITLLDDKEYLLEPDYLVIADDAGAVGLAGIMGGRHTAISETTTDVLFEAAHFSPGAIAGRARRLGVFTDAAQRYERGVDPTLPQQGIERATALLLQIAGGEPGPVSVVSATAARDPVVHWVPLRRARLTRLLGTPVPDDEVQAFLGAISRRVEATPDGWRVQPPPHRFDVRIEVDLVEEIARLRGFDSIPEMDAIMPQVAGPAPEAVLNPDRVLSAMADRGYREVITYSFVDAGLQRELFPGAELLVLSNPISTDLSSMRVSLWPGLVLACRDNLRRQQPRVRLFEIGRKFASQAATFAEIDTLAGIVTGPRWPEQWGTERAAVDFYDIKAELLGMLALTLAGDELRFEPESLGCLRPGRTARIYRGTVALGWLGELHPQVAKSVGLPAGVWLFELEMTSALSAKPIKYKPISKFPSVRRDLAVVVDESVPLAVLRENVTVSASGLLSEFRVFDIYRGPNIDSGRKSIALGLILQDSSRTLTDVDADAVVAAVTARLRDELSATIRDQ